MTTDSRHIDYFQTLHLKQVGLALAALWVVVFIAAAAAAIYRGVDGPAVSSTIARNVDLLSINSTLNQDLISARDANEKADKQAQAQLSGAQNAIDQLRIDLANARSDQSDLRKRLESYISSAPLIQIRP